MSCWLAIGSGPSSPQQLDIVRYTMPRPYGVITCNAGIKLWKCPDIYLAIDQVACKDFYETGLAAQAAGCMLVTLRREPSAMKERRTEHYDLLIDENPKALPHIGGYGRFRYSGPLMLEVALNHGATEIHLIGFDGYDEMASEWYFDQQSRWWTYDAVRLADRTEKAPLCQAVTEEALGRVAAAWSHAEFVVHGPSSYRIDSPNWRTAEQVA
jgi:hypothetical protein